MFVRFLRLTVSYDTHCPLNDVPCTTQQHTRERSMSSTQLIRRPEVEKMLSISCTTIYRLMSEGKFPKPVRIGDKAIAWRLSDIEAWIEARQAA